MESTKSAYELGVKLACLVKLGRIPEAVGSLLGKRSIMDKLRDWVRGIPKQKSAPSMIPAEQKVKYEILNPSKSKVVHTAFEPQQLPPAGTRWISSPGGESLVAARMEPLVTTQGKVPKALSEQLEGWKL